MTELNCNLQILQLQVNPTFVCILNAMFKEITENLPAGWWPTSLRFVPRAHSPSEKAPRGIFGSQNKISLPSFIHSPPPHSLSSHFPSTPTPSSQLSTQPQKSNLSLSSLMALYSPASSL